MAAWDNVEGFEFQHDLITPSLDRQAACLSLFHSPTSNSLTDERSEDRRLASRRSMLIFLGPCMERFGDRRLIEPAFEFTIPE